MKEKLQTLLKSEGLKSSQLAEILEINPAGISHILAGRNKPGFDLLQKILRRFPHINPDWLLLDSEQMYRNDTSDPKSTDTQTEQPTLAGLFAAPVPKLPKSGADASETSHASNLQNSASPLPPEIASDALTATGHIERIVIFYVDGTFRSFLPTKR